MRADHAQENGAQLAHDGAREAPVKAPPTNPLPTVLASAVQPALDLLPRRMDSARARVLLLAIGLQESRLLHRRQLVGRQPIGPAAGLWQFERGGGCAGVLAHHYSADLMRWVCRARGVAPTVPALWTVMQRDDVLAAGAARLLLYTDPAPLPDVSDAAGAWAYYLRVWRPGQPHPDTWGTMHAQALVAAWA